METPITKFLSRVTVLRKTPRGHLGFCPAHDDRHDPSLSVNEGRAGQVLLKCFAGCETKDIVAALGLTMRDLYPPRRAVDIQAERTRRRQSEPARLAQMHAVFGAEIRKVIERRDPWDLAAPVTTDEKNLARHSTGRALELNILPLARHPWECRAPWDRDPLWPAWFGANLRQAALERWHAGHPEARPGETDPIGPSEEDAHEASRRTAAQISAWSATGRFAPPDENLPPP